MPEKQLDSAFLFQQTQDPILTIRSPGGVVVEIVCDGNRTNQSFYFSPLFQDVLGKLWLTFFFVLLYVHLLKSLRNNWIAEKVRICGFRYQGCRKLPNSLTI